MNTFDEVIAAYLLAVDAGQTPDREELLARHPDRAEKIRAYFADQDRMERLVQPLRPGPDPDATLPPRAEAPTLPPGDPGSSLGTVRYFGDYELLEEIARGGMGVVYKARQVSLNRVVALKMILSGQLASPADVQRFRTEAKAVANLDHPNIVPVYEVGEYQGQQYFSMKLIEGEGFASWLAALRKNAPPATLHRKVANLMATVARAVHHAHQRGILHRDLKPGNILLTSRKRERRMEFPSVADASGSLGDVIPYITDFGLAKRVEGGGELTRSGDIVGTPSYMAPEQARATKQLSTAADVYSLGAILYECLTGWPPFRAAALLDTIWQVLEQEPVRPRSLEPSIDRDLETITMKCLEKDPARRYSSAEALADELDRWQRAEPIVARPAGRAERAWRWCRRNPTVAALVVTAVSALLAGTGVSLLFLLQAQASAQDAGRQAGAARAAAEREGQERELAGYNLYVARMQLAQAAWRDGNTVRMRELLDDALPKDEQPDVRGFEWHYLRRLWHAELTTFQGHVNSVRQVAFSPDGRHLACATFQRWDSERQQSVSGAVKVWDTQTGHVTLSLPEHVGYGSAIAFSPDGRWLARSGGDQDVEVWDLSTSQSAVTLHTKFGHIGCLTFSPDGTRLAVGTGSGVNDSTIEVFDSATARTLLTWRAHKSYIYSLAFSPDGLRLASGGSGESVRVWEALTGREILTLNSRTQSVSCVTFSPDGAQLASTSGDNAKVWDARTGQELFTFAGHSGGVSSVAFSPDGKRLASGSYDGTLKVWGLTTGLEMFSLKGHTGFVWSVAFSPDGKRLASGGDDRTAKLWDASTNPESVTLEGRMSVAFSPDGTRLTHGGPDRTIIIRDATSHRELLKFDGVASTLAFSPDGQRLAGAGSGYGRDRTVKVWDARSGQQILSLTRPGFEAWSAAFSPDGNLLAASGSAERNGQVLVWEAKTGREVLVLRLSTGGAGRVAFSPTGGQLACGDGDTVRVWDVTNGQEVLALTAPGARAAAIAFSPDGQRLAVGGGESGKPSEITVWDLSTGRAVLSLRGHTGAIMSVAFSPDGKRLASSTGSFGAGVEKANIVRVWELRTGQEVLALPAERRGVNHVAFSPDGRRLACASLYMVKLWDATARPVPLTANGTPAK